MRQLYLENSGGCSVCQMFAVQTCQERSDCKYHYHGLYVMLSIPCMFDFLTCTGILIEVEISCCFVITSFCP